MQNPIVELRQRNNIDTRRELARKTGFSYETCTLYETGQRQKLTERAVTTFSKVLSAEPEQLRSKYAAYKDALQHE